MYQPEKLKNNLTAPMDQSYTSYVEEIRPGNLSYSDSLRSLP